METGELLWHHRCMSRQLLWRHTDRLFWRCFYGRFHHNGVASQGRFSMAVHRWCIYRSVLLRFRGRIETDHTYGHTQMAVQRPVPLVLCRSGSTNHSSADGIVVNSYNNCRVTSSISLLQVMFVPYWCDKTYTEFGKRVFRHSSHRY